MKRKVNYQGKGLKLYAKDRFGNVMDIEPLSLRKGEIELEILKNEAYYQDDENVILYLYKGNGILEYENTLKKYDFEYLNVAFLDEFLSTNKMPQNADNFDQRLIKEFLEVYALNEKKKDYILPPFYEAKQSELLS